jgi:hypothetical protein
MAARRGPFNSPRNKGGQVSYPENDDMSEGRNIEAILDAYDRAVDKYRRLGIDVEQLLKRLLGVAKIPTSSVGFRVKERDSFER